MSPSQNLAILEALRETLNAIELLAKIVHNEDANYFKEARLAAEPIQKARAALTSFAASLHI